MDVFDKSIKKRIYDRLMYIISTQNWEHMGNQYWIKQCLELLFNTIQVDRKVVCSSNYSRLPSCLSVLQESNQPEAIKILEKYNQKRNIDMKGELLVTVKTSDQNFDEDKFFCLCSTNSILEKLNDVCMLPLHDVNLDMKTDFNCLLLQLSQVHGKFLNQLQGVKVAPFVNAISQLCHRSTLLAHKIWVDIFPQLWELLDERYQTVLCGEFGPFLCSGSHLAQTEGYRSAINTLVEGMSRCVGLNIRPCVLKYLGKTHNLWHQSALMLENMALACDDIVSVNPQLPLQQPWLDFGELVVNMVSLNFT